MNLKEAGFSKLSHLLPIITAIYIFSFLIFTIYNIQCLIISHLYPHRYFKLHYLPPFFYFYAPGSTLALGPIRSV